MSSSTTVNCLLYSYTPCCGGSPVYLARFDTDGAGLIFPALPNPPGIPHIWQYNGITPYTDHLGNSLIPGQCYNIQLTTITVNGVVCQEPYIVPSPTLSNFSETSHETCESASLDPKCNCTGDAVYTLTSCCPGSEPVIYNITNYDGSITNGNVYVAILDLTDYTTASCYLFVETTVPDPSVLPTIDISQIDTGASPTCESGICYLLCQPCRCEKFIDDPDIPGYGGLWNVLTCDLRQAQIRNTPTGTEINYLDGNPPQPVSEICLRFWQEIVPGIIRIDKGECSLVYWDENGSEFACPIYYKIVNCEDPAEEYCVTNDLSTEYGSNLVLTVNGSTFANKCWRIEITDPCPQTITISYTITHADCADCLSKIADNYELINCNDNEVIVYTSTNLHDYIGTIITLVEYPDDCWYVQSLTSAIPSDIPVTFNQQFQDCQMCLGPQYLLEDCDIDNPDPNIITNTDLSAYVGQVVTLLNCPDKCWLVSDTDPIPTPQLVNVTANYQDCELCIQPTPIPTPPVYKYKSVTPGYNTPGCEPDKFERILCNFSEAMYRQIMVDAYGITPCCGEDDIKYEIKYELIKLVAINDPDFNCPPANTCECTTSTVGLSQDNCVPTPPPPPVSYNCVETVTCVQYNCIIYPLNGGTLFYKDCEGIFQQLSFPMGKFAISYPVCSIPNATSNDIYVTGSPGGFTFTQTPVNCESTVTCVEVQGTSGTYPTLIDCQTNCGQTITPACNDCIKITIVPKGGGAPIVLTVPATGMYSNNTPYYDFIYDGSYYEIYNSNWNQIGGNPGTWLLYSYDLSDDIGQYGVISDCPYGTYEVDPAYFDSFVVDYCGGVPTGYVLYSVFLNPDGATGVYFTYPDCNDVVQQYDLPAARGVTNVFVCSRAGRLQSEFVQNGGIDFSVVETTIPCNC